MASEEHEDIVKIPEEYPKGRYVLIYDPLDGSSNIDVNVSVGTIFAIFRTINWELRGRLEDCLQAGRVLVAAGYVLYGSSTMLVYSTGNGVHGFTLDPEIGEFLLSHENMMMPDPPRYYSVNHSYFGRWSTGV
jgi:fructose-1,6-bisphosphatase I